MKVFIKLLKTKPKATSGNEKLSIIRNLTYRLNVRLNMPEKKSIYLEINLRKSQRNKEMENIKLKHKEDRIILKTK